MLDATDVLEVFLMFLKKVEEGSFHTKKWLDYALIENCTGATAVIKMK